MIMVIIPWTCLWFLSSEELKELSLPISSQPQLPREVSLIITFSGVCMLWLMMGSRAHLFNSHVPPSFLSSGTETLHFLDNQGLVIYKEFSELQDPDGILPNGCRGLGLIIRGGRRWDNSWSKWKEQRMQDSRFSASCRPNLVLLIFLFSTQSLAWHVMWHMTTTMA